MPGVLPSADINRALLPASPCNRHRGVAVNKTNRGRPSGAQRSGRRKRQGTNKEDNGGTGKERAGALLCQEWSVQASQRRGDPPGKTVVRCKDLGKGIPGRVPGTSTCKGPAVGTSEAHCSWRGGNKEESGAGQTDVRASSRQADVTGGRATRALPGVPRHA